MKIKNIYQLSMNNIVRNKTRTIINILFLNLCMTVLFVSTAIIYTSYIAIDENINNQLQYRKFVVQVNLKDESIKKTDYISLVNNIAEISDTSIDNTSLKDTITITVNDYKNVNRVVQQLKEQADFSIIFNSEDIVNVPIIYTVKFASLAFFICIVFLNFIVLCMILSNIINERTNDLAIFKVAGYTNKNLFTLILSEGCIFCFISFILSAILSNLILFFIINPIIKAHFKDTLIGIEIVISPNIYGFAFVILLLLVISSSLNMTRKIKKISPIQLLTD
jgi:ABC-type antimicrobial peptide transport system permease subunit